MVDLDVLWMFIFHSLDFHNNLKTDISVLMATPFLPPGGPVVHLQVRAIQFNDVAAQHVCNSHLDLQYHIKTA